MKVAAERERAEVERVEKEREDAETLKSHLAEAAVERERAQVCVCVCVLKRVWPIGLWAPSAGMRDVKLMSSTGCTVTEGPHLYWLTNRLDVQKGRLGVEKGLGGICIAKVKRVKKERKHAEKLKAQRVKVCVLV